MTQAELDAWEAESVTSVKIAPVSSAFAVSPGRDLRQLTMPVSESRWVIRLCLLPSHVKAIRPIRRPNKLMSQGQT